MAQEPTLEDSLQPYKKGAMGLMWNWWDLYRFRQVRGVGLGEFFHWLTLVFQNIRQKRYSRAAMSFE